MQMQFNFFGEAAAPQKPRKKRHNKGGWDLIPHACKHCRGRLLRRENPDGAVVVRCAECGASAAGEHDALCYCGVEVRGHGRVFECIENPSVSPAMPQQVLVREKPLVCQQARTPGRITNPVRIHGFE